MKQNNKKHIITRFAIISGVILFFAAGIIYKLANTTILHASEWNKRAETTLSSVIDIEPERGKILADDGSVLAANLHFYTVRIDWSAEGFDKKEFNKKLDALCDSLALFSQKKNPRTAKEWYKILKCQFEAEKKNKAFRLYDNLSHGEYTRLKDFPFFNLRKNKNGLYTETKMRRSKPYGSMAARSIGIVGEDSIRKTHHGVAGLEKALDSLLYGKPGKATKIQLTNSISPWESTPAMKGYDIMTTINVGLQDIVEEELYKMCQETGAEWGSAILMEVSTGEIKAISNLEWNKSFNDYVEGRNNAVLGYEPGSVMKPISMMIALEDGIVNNINEVITTGTSFAYAGGRPITDAHGAASMPVRQVIGSSSNIGMAKIILKKYAQTPGLFYHRLKGMGFFEPLHMGIAGEEIPKIDSLRSDNPGRIGLSRMAFGYSTRIPPICTLAMYNAIANDGKYVRPRLVKQLCHDDVVDSIVPISYIRQQVCSPVNAQKLRIMLHDVVWSDHGTARVLKDDNVEIVGKTGTCYTIEDGQYSAKKRYAFCGFFPFNHPKYSCIVLMKGGDRGAARCSGMVLKNIALKLYSKGLLNNNSIFKANNNEVKHDNSTTLYATNNPNWKNIATHNFGVTHPKKFKSPAPVKNGGVPNVIGFSVKEAVAELEGHGLTVRIQGTGYVSAQSIPAGSAYKKGQIINLILKI